MVEEAEKVGRLAADAATALAPASQVEPQEGLEQSRSSHGAGFTPGPWSMTEPPYDSVPWLHIYGPPDRDGSGRHIMHADRPDAEKIANARLIAAAPDLYEALSDLLRAIGAERAGVDLDGWMDAVDATDAYREQARAALAKAQGQQP